MFQCFYQNLNTYYMCCILIPKLFFYIYSPRFPRLDQLLQVKKCSLENLCDRYVINIQDIQVSKFKKFFLMLIIWDLQRIPI